MWTGHWAAVTPYARLAPMTLAVVALASSDRFCAAFGRVKHSGVVGKQRPAALRARPPSAIGTRLAADDTVQTPRHHGVSSRRTLQPLDAHTEESAHHHRRRATRMPDRPLPRNRHALFADMPVSQLRMCIRLGRPSSTGQRPAPSRLDLLDRPAISELDYPHRPASCDLLVMTTS